MKKHKSINKDGWKRIGRKRRMRYFGDIDFKTKIIRVNKSKKKNKEKGEIIDTIVHEEGHRLHPGMHEKTIRKYTKKVLVRLGRKQKKRLYSRYA